MTDTTTARMEALATALDAYSHMGDAGDDLRALVAERKALRDALIGMVYETTHLSPMEDDGSHWCKIRAATLAAARAALEATHD